MDTFADPVLIARERRNFPCAKSALISGRFKLAEALVPCILFSCARSLTNTQGFDAYPAGISA